MHITILLLIFSYLIGSIPSGLIFSKILNKGDIRKSGSGNIGATNALRVGGKLLGSLTLMFDLLKGLIVVIVAKLLGIEFIGIYGFACILGHIFPIWLKFRGGKGVATVFGVVLGMHVIIGAVMMLLWIIVFRASKISSLASLSSITISIIALSFGEHYIDSIFLILSLLLIVYKHKDNIIRLYNGEESKISL
ncbi:glycerol-3-phosphate 1-O-acyltransferase PlsY [Rickettsiales endosymbiont of Trichoplax sp. H2]|uniref:glycerol-3-phosphate 1-O-acyltransferase PlsY n=1 Tax=Rickettsiales endosymbiont of Trichoplax sp. H2 TaxID=2021221 RepID=UPI0012B3FE28|nr:glycerol-3-phosphate 1-O-acyltransferase PlsY [Rickettsiales endosymbiont of Trichoplax sp. H2]MSO14296.1 Glycerol-3-phosphate acyltransferase [Rickettsiales endosymbiont of Trichoplax sp. H2]